MKRIPRPLIWMISVIGLFFLLMTLYRFVFFFHYRGTARPFSGSAFLLGMRYDARMVSILGLLMLLLNFIPLLNPFLSNGSRRFWNILLTLIFLIFLIFYGSDFYHYDYLQQRLNASVLNFFADAGISSKMVWQTYPIISISFAMMILCFAFFKLHHYRLGQLQKKQAPEMKRPFRILAYTIFVLVLSGFSFGKLGQYPLRWSDAFAFSDDFKANTALNPFQSFFSSLQFRSAKYDLKKVKVAYPFISDYFGIKEKDNERLNFQRQIVYEPTGRPPMNVVLVICESFSAYKSSMFGNHLNPTPYFNELCNQGLFFERCFTPAFGTARGVWATITGIPDVQQPKTASRNPAAVDQHTIINDFNGYEKFYFLGGSTTWANIRGLLKNNIDSLHIIEQEDFKSEKVDVWGISDKNLFLESNKILSQQQKPFFAIIQTADNHRPYTIPAEDLNSFKKLEFPKDSLKKYGFEDNDQFNAFRYADYNFRQFIESAKKEKYFNNTLFVFVGDHGLRGDAGDMFPASFTKQGFLAEHVPLLFYAPNHLNPQKISKVASQLDVLPTIASITRQSHVNSSMGRDLTDTSDHKNHYAFIADPDLLTISLIGDQYAYVKQLKTGKEEWVSVLNNESPDKEPNSRSLFAEMQNMTAAWYETAKYLLLNNKKSRK